MLDTLSPSFDFSPIDRADLADSTRIKYKSAIAALLTARVNPFDYQSLTTYAASLPASGRAFLKAALTCYFKDKITEIKSNATPANLAQVQAAIMRIEAMNEAIPTHQPKGVKAHVWLTREQVEEITALPDRSTARGLRDYIVLATLLGAGLRREELSNLTFDSLKQQPSKNGLRDILTVTGKGNKRRTIPVSAKLALYLRQWHKLAGDGYVARGINKSGVINSSLSAIGIHDIVRQYGALIGVPQLDSHDLRRSYAMLGLNAGVPITQISVLLGHANIATTQRYLDLEIDLESTVSDYVPLSGD